MASITTRVGKGSPLSTQELDANFTNLNADKLEKSGESATFADLTLESAAETLHRSPNAITAMFVYDTSKDSDLGAWTEKCRHTSWYNEDLCGKWLGAQASEAAARAVSGATTDDYYQLTTDGKFYKLNAGSGTTEVFRGNKRSFPKVAGIVAEAASVTIYDLTEPGSPMWMRWNVQIPDASWGGYPYFLFSNTVVLDIGAAEATLILGTNATSAQWGGGLVAMNFAGDVMYRLGNVTGSTSTGEAELKYVSTRHIKQKCVQTWHPNLVDYALNVERIFVGVLPNAPIDMSTGLLWPTVILARDRYLHVVRNMKSAIKSAASGWSDAFFINKKMYAYRSGTGALEYSNDISALSNGFSLTSLASGSAPDFMRGAGGVLVPATRSDFRRANGVLAQSMRNYEITPTKSITSAITDTYNAGHLLGDIRRAYLANSATADRSYKSATATANGTITSAAVNTDTDLVAYSGFSGSNYLQEPYSADLDFGTGEWSVGAWVNVPVTLPSASTLPEIGGETITDPNFDTGTGWVNFLAWAPKPTISGGLVVFGSGNNSLGTPIANKVVGATYKVVIEVAEWPEGKTLGFAGESSLLSNQSISRPTGGVGTVTLYGTAASGSYDGIGFYNGAGAGSGIQLTSVSVKQVSPVVIASRAYSSGPNVFVGVVSNGKLTATAYDGTTTRTVTTSAAYNTATWLKAEAEYTTDGALAIRVNGQKVATTTGTPLLTLNGRYNLLTWTESFDTAAWTKENLTITANAALSPFGDTTAEKMEGNGINGSHRAYQFFSASTDQKVFSIFSKAGTNNFIQIYFIGDATPWATFDVANGLVGSQGTDITPTITDIGGGWYRCDCAITSTTANGVHVSLANALTDTRAQANALTTYMYIWGAQLEIGTTASAYQRVTTVAETNVPALTIGNSYALDAPFPGSIALLKLSATVPTTEQAAWMYEQEKQLFREGAKCVLPASTSVLDLTYDDVTDTWSALQASYESTWSGLVRTSTQAPSAGSFSKVSAGSGIKLLGRTTTNPGVDVQLPAKNLRTKEMPPDTNQDLVVFDFDAVTSQTDFALPVGYTARVVYSAGAQKREGSTKDWTRLFDGFVETIRFGTAPGNAVWVQIHATKEVA